MRELVLQKKVCDVVNAAGGFAHKLSHRFIVGVPDLFVQLPGTPPYPAIFLEAKIRSMPIRLESFRLDVTPLQSRFLRRACAAGMRCGLLSVLDARPRLLYALIASIDAWGDDEHDFEVFVGSHVQMRGDRDWLDLLGNFARG